MLKRALVIVTSAIAATAVFATPAHADPGDNPCDLAITFLCRFVPIAPDLDHDIDVTQGQQVDPNTPPPDSIPAADPCVAGCI